MKQSKQTKEDFGNRIPSTDRLLALAITLISLVTAYDVLLSDKATFVEKRRLFQRLWSTEPLTVVVLDGWPIFWMFLVLVMISLMGLTFLIDHYDRRFNERFYTRLRRIMMTATAAIALVGVVAAYQQIWSR